MASDPTAIDVRLTRTQAAIIWRGLNFIQLANLTRASEGSAISSYPFYITPLPPTVDTGRWSQAMMRRVEALWRQFKPRAGSGGRFKMNFLDLRIAAYAARLGVKLRKKDAEESPTRPKRGSPAWKRAEGEYLKLKSDTQRVVTSLEKLTKRATRLFLAVRPRDEFSSLGTEWRRFLRWMKFHLTYLYPHKVFKSGNLKGRRLLIDAFVAVAENAILTNGFELPESRELRHVMRMYARYCRRGQISDWQMGFLRLAPSDPLILGAIFDFVSNRLQLKEQTNR